MATFGNMATFDEKKDELVDTPKNLGTKLPVTLSWHGDRRNTEHDSDFLYFECYLGRFIKYEFHVPVSPSVWAIRYGSMSRLVSPSEQSQNRLVAVSI